MNGFSKTRRNFLRGTGALLGTTAMGIRADDENFRTVSIFHTTDLHGHILPTRTYEGVENVGGFARCATRIRQWRRESPHSLLVDIGDVYQGTAESLLNKGNLMIGLFNRLGYDAWVLGNHDFDWGAEALENNLTLSKAPILTGNIRVGGKAPGALDGAWKSVLPWTMKEVDGFRIALIGLVTPGMHDWLAPETLGGVVVEHPLASLQGSIAGARAQKADAIVVIAHMGYRPQDDYANPLREILKQAPGVDVFLAGHSHQIQPSWKHGNVLCSQAAYFGIHCGRVDLVFDRNSRKLVGREARTELMDGKFEFDPAVMEMAAPNLKTAAEQLARKLGTVARPVKSGGHDNPLAQLFCECFAEALRRNQTPVDGVYHGTFGTGDLPAGDITVGDCWKLLPYENRLVTAEIGARDLIEIIKEERSLKKSDRILWPFDLKLDSQGGILSFKHRDTAVADDARFTIAFNCYDGQSGSRALMRLREIVSRPSAKRHMTGINTRSALIDAILERGVIG